MRFRPALAGALIVVASGATAIAQVPRPFPQPGQPAKPAPAAPAPSAPAPATASAAQTGDPTEATLGVPIYPAAQFITSYDAGRGQRFYLFGTSVPYPELVNFYRSVLKTRGDELYETPPTHQFEIGRYRDEVMAFPPSVTIKDYAWSGTGGFANPRRGAQPERFVTVIQIVPNPAGAQ